jgi:peptide/nickel transport system substrate-binding protein
MTFTLAACSSSNSSSSAGKTSVTIAEPANAPAYYIFPLTPMDNYNGLNDAYFQDLIYRPLYWIGDHGAVKVNDQISLADQPTYTDGGKTAVIKLRDYKWSDGTTITSRDVAFFWNLLKVSKENWAGYVPGEFPDNVTSVATPDDKTITFTFDKVYNPEWILYNELSQLTPMPQHAWDLTSASGKVGDYDTTPAGAQKVYDYLIAQAKNAGTYASNQLWKIVSGPWTVQSFANGNEVTFAANDAYSGPIKPTLKTVILKPFTSDTAEFNVLAAGGGVDFGYVPPQNGAQKSRVEAKGYTTTVATSWSINYMVPNFNNPTVGPILRQLPVRQALEHLIDQDGWIKGPLGGYGKPTYGSVPTYPDNPFVSAAGKANAFPYDPQAAIELLTKNGWDVKPNGVTTCKSPGSGAGQCGAGIAAGAPLSFKVEYASGLGALDNAMQAEKSAFAQAGITLELVSEPLETVNANEAKCASTDKNCGWQLVQGDLAWTFQPNYYPEGSLMFGTNGCCNAGSYDSAKANALIAATHTSTSKSALTAYQDFLQKELPVFWTPKAESIVAVDSNLTGTQPSDPFSNLYPEEWRWK